MRTRELRVGATLLVALAILSAAVLLIGQENNLFSRKARYHVDFGTASGLSEGSPVQLDGVRVGLVDKIFLPEDISQQQIIVWLWIDRRYAPRVREDSVARIKTLGLLGDKYIAISSGTPEFAALPNRAGIPTAGATDVDKLLASGEDVVENVVGISHSLKNLLRRMERGEGLLGKMVTDSPDGDALTGALTGSLKSVERIARSIEEGKGPIGRLIHDENLGDDMAAAVVRFNGLLDKAENGEGALAALLSDPKMRDDMGQAVASARVASGALATFATDLQKGDGLVPRLIHDEEYGREVSDELREMVQRLNRLSATLESGDGTIPKLINDPTLYDAMNDVVVGVNDSAMLRWLIQNRQKKGIEKRYEEERRKEEGGAEPAAQTPSSAPGSP